MKLIKFIFLLLPLLLSSQQKIPFDSLKLKDTRDLFSDDYGNIYIYKNKDFSFTKYDSLGNQLGRIMLTFPYKVQSISNPLNIVMFSENTQELRLVDQNLNEIQKISLSSIFGFVKHAYIEDLQYAWLLDESNKTLIQYNFRTQTKLSSFPFNINYQDISDFLVYNNNVYILKNNQLLIYTTQSTLLASFEVPLAQKLKRYKNQVLVLASNSVWNYDGSTINQLIKISDAKIVDKIPVGFLALIADNLYIYKSKF